MLLLLNIACSACLAVASIVCLYHIVLAGASLCRLRFTSDIDDSGSLSFAIVIPAYNEEHCIGEVLRSCAELDYPRQNYTVHVVADNCDDRTVQVATEHGATCLVRSNGQSRGKGHALEWAFDRISLDAYDAVVVLDADCLIDSHALRAFARRLNAGDQVLQASSIVANPDDNVMSYVLALANAAENDLFYTGKSAVGLAVFLRGTGMVFRREVLERCPWRAESIVEDVEYSCQLLKEGFRIKFLHDVHVASDFPTRRDELVIQRTRWIGGGARLGMHYSMGLLRKGIVKRKLLLIDAGWTMLVVNRSLIVMQLLLTLVLSLACWLGCADLWSGTLLLGSLAVATTYFGFVAAAVLLLGVTARRMRLLVGAPLLVVSYLRLALRALVSSQSGEWARTPRSDDAGDPV